MRWLSEHGAEVAVIGCGAILILGGILAVCACISNGRADRRFAAEVDAIRAAEGYVHEDDHR